MMTLERLKWPNVTNSATQLVAAAITPRPCGPRNRAVMTVPIMAPSIQYAFVPLVSVTAFHKRIEGSSYPARRARGVGGSASGGHLARSCRHAHAADRAEGGDGVTAMLTWCPRAKSVGTR